MSRPDSSPTGARSPAAGSLRFGDAVADLPRARLVRPDGSVPLTTREAQLLGYLAERLGEEVSREELLTEVWRYRSSNPTRAVDITVRRVRSKIEPEPSRPRFLLSVAGVGYRLVADAAPPDPAPRVVGRPLGPLFGREAILERIRSALAGGARLITLLGAPGVGKTRVGNAVLDLEQPLFPGDGAGAGRVACGVGECVTSADLLQAVALAVGAPRAADGPEARAIDDLGAELRRRGPLLLLLDDFDRLGHCAGVLARWAGAAPELRCLVTSRQRLGVPAERVLEVPPLARADAAALFAHRSPAGTAGHEDVVREIATRLEGIPLAIELAAALHGRLTLAEIAARVRSGLESLGEGGGPPTEPTRRRSLTATLEWSWSQLDRWEAWALARASVFRDGFDLEAAEVVLAPASPEAPWVIDLLQALVDKSLVQLAPGGGRFHLLESIRGFASRRLEDSADAAEARRRHADHYLSWAERASARRRAGPGSPHLVELARERANLLAIAGSRLDPARTASAVIALTPLLALRGASAERAALLDLGVDAAVASGDAVLEIKARQERAEYRVQVERGGGGVDLGRVLELTAGGLLPWWRAQALITLGIQRTIEGNRSAAVACHLEAVALAEAHGDAVVHASALNQLGYALARSGDRAGAEARYVEALARCRSVSEEWIAAMVLGNHATLSLELGRVDEAEAQAAEAIRILESFGAHRLLGRLHTNLAVHLARDARWERAEAHLRASLDHDRAGDDPTLRAFDLATLAHLLTHQDRLDEARALLAEALAIDAAHPSGRRSTLQRYQGVLLHHLGEVDQAVDWLERARVESQAAGHALGMVSATAQLALALADRGELRLASVRAAEAVELAGEHGQDALLPLVASFLAIVLSLDPARGPEALAALAEARAQPPSTGWLADIVEIAEAHVVVQGGGTPLPRGPAVPTAEHRLLRRLLDRRSGQGGASG